MELCDLCKELDLSPLLPTLGEADKTEGAEWSRHKFARVDYILGHATTCSLCRLIGGVLVYLFCERGGDEDNGDAPDEDLSKASPSDSDDDSDDDGDGEMLGKLVTALVVDGDLLSSEQQLRDLAPRFTVSVHLNQKLTLKGGPTHQIDLTVEGPRTIFQLLSLVALQDNPPYGCGSARRVDPKQVNYQKLKQWIRICEDHHQGCKPPITWTQPRAKSSDMNGVHPFMVIDVIEQRVVTAPQDCRYAALSYVWGPVEMQFQVQQANLAAVSAKFGLAGVETELPETIKDAMHLVKEIGERYLWVDNMCIVQDDQTSKNYWIHEMATVYAGAVVTIVAAAGVDSSAGLPGVRRGTRQYPQFAEEVKPGLTLATLSSQTTLVEDSKYSSRGWTFQERMLSTRNLVFLPNEAFFECRQAVFVEEVACEDASFSYEEHDQIYDLGVFSPFKKLAGGSDNYSTLVEMYTLRRFSNESDALNAFAGMLRVLSLEMRSHFLCGHPIEDFGETLLWTLDRDEVHNGTRRKGFPSWAWSGWTGEKQISNIPWLVESTESDESELSDMGEGDSVRSFIWWRAEVQDDCYQISSPTHTLQEALQTCIDGEQLLTFNQPDYSYLPHLPRYSDTLQQVRLRFWTIVAPFRLSRKSMPCIMDSDSEDFEGSSVSMGAPLFFSIWGENDTWCGEVVDCCGDDMLTEDPTVYELVILGLCFGFLSAMVVKWEAGVAERTGLARLFMNALNAVLEPGIQWREIVLG